MQAELLASVPWLAVVLAVMWNLVLGYAWYHRKAPTGKVWAAGMGMQATGNPQPGEVLRGIILTVLGSALTMTVLAYLLLAMQGVYDSDLDWLGGALGGVFVWGGFVVPLLLGGMAWERKSGAVTLVNAGYHLLSLAVAGMLVGLLG